MSDCKRAWEADALREGRLSSIDADSFGRHRRACRVCAQTFADDENLRTLGRALASPIPNEIHARRLRGEILRRAAERSGTRAPSRSRRRVWATLAAAALTIACIVGVAHRASAPLVPLAQVASLPSEAALAAIVSPQSGARWTQARKGNIERIRLVEGAIVVQVRHQTPGERFLVDLPDGELEVRGTRFEVVVRGGRTVSVDVFEGLVALRPLGDNEALLAAGEVWRKPLDVESLPPHATAASPEATKPSRVPVTAPRVKSSAAVIESTDYAQAMDLYRSREYVQAERAFHAFAVAHPDAPEAEDATFLEASALARSGRGDAAALVAEGFLERYPTSFHGRDAAVLVARAARERGDCRKARAALAPWKTAAPEEVAAALATCRE